MLAAYKLCIPEVPTSYEGRLYFILGPGLGDTVNDFRILHEVLLRYPGSTAIVYADPRWKGLYELLPERAQCSWRFHMAAPSGELAGKQREQSYSETFRGVIEEIRAEITDSSGVVALGGFTCLNQLAQKELGLATKARCIGLPLTKDQCRPFLPLDALPLEEVNAYLARQGFQPGGFIAIAPQTWADKAWEPSCWKRLIQALYEETQLPILVLGLEGCDVGDGPGIHKALGLPLSQVAGIIAQARCFVGLDSGLTHMAACFDVPIVGLQAQGKFPPFFVEPHSPMRRIHLTPLVYGSATIPPESVQVLVREALQSPQSPVCPLCEDIPYVLGAHDKQIAYLCRCGLMYRGWKSHDGQSDIENQPTYESALPYTIDELVALKKSLQGTAASDISDQPDAPLALTFEHWNSREISPQVILSDSTNRELWWSWDAVYHLLASHGWKILESRGGSISESEGSAHSFSIKAMPARVATKDVVLQIPWGKDLVWLKRSLYQRWLCWETFERANELEDLGWRLVKEGYERDGRDILRFAAKREWRGRTLSRLIRSEWKALGSGMKNSQDIPAHA